MTPRNFTTAENRALRDRLAVAMRDRGWSQERTARELVVPQTTVSRLLRGGGFNRLVALRLAALDGGTVESILAGAAPAPRSRLALTDEERTALSMLHGAASAATMATDSALLRAVRDALASMGDGLPDDAASALRAIGGAL